MCHNVNESLREVEAAGENNSYTSKIKNGENLNNIYALIEKVKLEVFRGDEDAENDFRDQKLSQSGTFMDQRRRNNGK